MRPLDTFAGFRSAFPDIRARLDWKRFSLEGWPIAPVSILPDRGVGGICLPWFIDASGKEVSYRASDAKPVHLEDIPARLEGFTAERRRKIEAILHDLRQRTSPIIERVPAYSLPDGEFLILDGSHRLCALILSGLPYELTLWAVHGPFDPECLPDLRHWQTPDVPPST